MGVNRRSNLEETWNEFHGAQTRAEKLRSSLIEHFDPVIRRRAQRLGSKLREKPKDLAASASLGLLRAFDVFDPQGGQGFERYCIRWIEKAMLRQAQCNAHDRAHHARAPVQISNQKSAISKSIEKLFMTVNLQRTGVCESREERERLERNLLKNLKKHRRMLRELLDRVNGKWFYEDRIYRFYYQSFKVFDLQEETQQMVAAFAQVAPEGRDFCDFFQRIVRAGTGWAFELEDNKNWLEKTAPIVQAFLHARYFLEMAVKYGQELKTLPLALPSGWAAVLCLYDIR